MAMSNKIQTTHGEAFPHGAYVTTEVEQVRDFERSSKDNFVQQHDKETGLPLWEVGVHDADPDARKANRQITVKIAAEHQPVPPEALPGTPFRPVEFEGLTVTPYLDDKACKPAGPGERHRCRARIAYSFRASGMRSPSKGARSASNGAAGSASGEKAVA